MIKDKYKVESIKSQETYDWLLHKHYAKRIPPISYAFGLFKDKELLGVCTYGNALLNCTTEAICGKKYKKIVVDLSNSCIIELGAVGIKPFRNGLKFIFFFSFFFNLKPYGCKTQI